MGDYMELKVGDYVTRNSYHNDLVFKITKIESNVCYLKGVNIRLYADSFEEDLSIYNDEVDDEEEISTTRSGGFGSTNKGEE